MFNKGKKHKRGDRGSFEEENSVSIAKKQNMAANLDESSKEEGAIESEEEEEETSLEEIKSLLVGVQQTLLDMRTENRRMAAEITELKSSFNKHSTEISSLKKSLNKALEDNDKLKKSVDSLKKKVEEQDRNINELYGQQDDLEQYTRKHTLEIHGIPEDLYTATEDVVIKLGERLNVPITNEDIDISHKLFSGKNQPKGIIVKFLSHKKKAQLYRKRTELKNVKISDLFPDCSTADVVQSTRIFINENLTQYRRGIMKKANKMRRDGMIQSVWSLDGKLYVKTSPSGTPIRICCEDDLNNL
jgi:myosin heavy subunit